MDILFVLLFLVSIGGIGYGSVRSIANKMSKKNHRKGDNKRIILSSAAALIVSFVGIGITAPPSEQDIKTEAIGIAAESTTDTSEQAEVARRKAEEARAKEEQEIALAEQEKNTQELNELRLELSKLEYEETQTIEINDNSPHFSSLDLSLDNGSWEKYGDLDTLNRATSAEAILNQDLMPTEKRGNISNVEPTGWDNKKIGNGYLYNRSHLIGFALSGENDNWKNLITGTTQLNNPEMLRHEMDVKYYLEQSEDNYVRYSVTPIFREDELLARGVHLMAQSINDDEISFNVYIFNVQNGANLNYSDGSSETDEEIAAAKKAEEDRKAAEKAEYERIEAEKVEQERIAAEKAEQQRIAEEEAAQEQQANQHQETQYVDANGQGTIKGSNSGIYHVPGSTYYSRTTNVAQWFKTVSEAENAGYRAPKR